MKAEPTLPFLSKKETATRCFYPEGKAAFDHASLDALATSLKSWAEKRGATHFTYWFQPLKKENFPKKIPLEKLQGKDLFHHDFSRDSYLVWDSTVFPFILEEVLYIPSLLFSKKDEALDYKIPFIRSEEKLRTAFLKGMKTSPFSTLQIESEYYLMDRELFLQRPDLVKAGRTVFGAKFEGKGKNFHSLKTKIESCIADFTREATQIGISHKEEKASLAIDQNILFQELLQKIAPKYDLVPLFHEKPFAGVKELRKTLYWSIAHEQDVRQSLVLYAAIIRAVHEHQALLRASILNLDGVIAIHDGLKKIAEEIIQGKSVALREIPFLVFTKDMPASTNPALFACVMNAIVADSLALIYDEIHSAIGDRKLSEEKELTILLQVLKKHLEIKEKESPRKFLTLFQTFIEKKSLILFEDILNEQELQNLYETLIENEGRRLQMEAELMIELFEKQIVPKIKAPQTVLKTAEELKKLLSQILDFGWEAKAKAFSELIEPKMEELRNQVDQLEHLAKSWPLPKYQEMLL